MSAPRHLWSGDWRLESAAAAEGLAERRAQTEPPGDTRPEPEPVSGESVAAQAIASLRGASARGAAWPRTASARGITGLRSGCARAAAWLRAAAAARPAWRPPMRLVGAVALLLVLLGAAAFGAVSLLTGSGGARRPATAAAAPGWLGVQTTSSPFGAGALVAWVIPGSPAAAAGLMPGDVITQINNRPVTTAGGVSSALSGLHPGARVEVHVQQGPIAYTTQVTLGSRRAGGP